MRRIILGVAGAVAAYVGYMAWDGSAAQPPHQDAQIVARGAVIYAENCAKCHGAELQGQAQWRLRDADGFLPAPPHDETGHTWHHPDQVLFDITKYGSTEMVGKGYQSNMPGFEGQLSDAQIGEVLAFIKSTWPSDIVQMQTERSGG